MAKITGYENPFINCNEFGFGGKKVFASQSPLNGKEHGRKELLKNTCEKHMAMIPQNNIGVTVQLRETWGTDNTGNRYAVLGEYYSEEVGKTIKNGRYFVKTVGKEENLVQFTEKEKFVLFHLEITDTDTGEMFRMDVLMYKGWEICNSNISLYFGFMGKPPATPDTALEILKFMDTYEKNALINCYDGTGPTGCLIAIKYGIEICQKKKVVAPSEIIGHVCSIRFGSVRFWDLLFYTILSITRGVMLARGIEFCPEYSEMEYYYNRHLSKAYDILDTATMNTERYTGAQRRREEWFAEDQKQREKYVNDKWKEYIEAKKLRQETDKKELAAQKKKGKSNSKDGSKKSKQDSKGVSKQSDVQVATKKKDLSKKSEKKSKEAKSKTNDSDKKNKEKGVGSKPSKETGGAKAK